MTGLSITVANIRSQIPGFVDILDSDGGVADVTLKGLEPHLEKMVSPDGMNCVIDGRPTKVHIGWNYDDANRINGLFASIYQDNPNGVSLRAFKMVARDEDCEKLFVTQQGITHTIQNNEDEESKKRFKISFWSVNDLFDKGIVTPHEGEATFNTKWIDQEKVRDFYKKNQEILDNLLQNSFSPSSSSASSSSSNDSISSTRTDRGKYLFLGGALLLVLAIAL